jgi:hypothetical protein
VVTRRTAARMTFAAPRDTKLARSKRLKSQTGISES